MRFAAAWGSRETLDATLVHPDLVAEINADTAIVRGGVHRHPVRFKRLRLDVSVEEVPSSQRRQLRMDEDCSALGGLQPAGSELFPTSR
ncbi:hypothetical protein ACFQ7Z_17690 [Streptomyces virginiae]|uniref:hypothetical protein n=1 Tax=Streptomyces virginiae TaxID=1961 RepID=UPI00367C2626